MKIFYTKKDRELVEGLKEDIKNIERYYTEKLLKVSRENTLKGDEIEQLKEQLQKMYGRCGGLIKKNNQLKNEIEQLKEQTPKITRIKKCTGSKQKMGVKARIVQSNIIKREKSINEN